MSKIQVTVTEKNGYEGETFHYVLMVTREEAKIIKDKIEELNLGENESEVYLMETNLTENEIDAVIKYSGNSYMNLMDRYELEDGALDDWEEDGDVFYKGTGLKRIESF